MSSSVSTILKQRRKELGLSVKAVCEDLRKYGVNVSEKTLYGWEAGHRQPDADTFVILCDVYHIGSFSEIKKAPLFSSEAMKLAKDYDTLDAWGQKQVRSVADIQLDRCREESSRSTHMGQIIEVYPTRKYIQRASAGYGDFNDDDSYEMIDLIMRPPLGTSFIITVNGDSMEPTYHHDEMLFVRAQETIQIGEIGLFSINGDLYIKEFGKYGLISHNDNGNYPLIVPSENDMVKVEGKVLGVCSSDYLQ